MFEPVERSPDLRDAAPGSATGTVGPVDPTSVPGSKVRHVLGEIVRFLIVGGLATLVSFVGFNALVHGLLYGAAPLHERPVLAFVLVNVVAGFVAYAGMRAWTFRDRDVTDTATGIVRFFTLGALTMAVPVLCLWVSRNVLGLSSPLADNLAANVIGLGLGAAARFWVFRQYVFTRPTAPRAVPADRMNADRSHTPTIGQGSP